MDVYYGQYFLLTAFKGYDAVIVFYIHISVGFGGVRFDKQAMPKFLYGGLVTSRFPRLFYI